MSFDFLLETGGPGPVILAIATCSTPDSRARKYNVTDEKLSQQIAALCAEISELAPRLDGEVSGRHKTILEGVHSLASLAEDLLDRERTGRVAAEVEAEHSREMVQELE